MLSPEECRRIDPALTTLSDEQLVEAVELLDRLAELVLEDWFSRQAQQGSNPPAGIVHSSDEPVP
jgi:hypothetical protein